MPVPIHLPESKKFPDADASGNHFFVRFFAEITGTFLHAVFLQLRVAEGIDHRLNADFLLTERARIAVIGSIVRYIVTGKNGVDRNAVHFTDRTEQRSNAANQSAVIAHTFNAAANADAGCNGCHQQNDILAAHHRFNVFTEKQLAVCRAFRANDINGLMCIVDGVSGILQLLCKECADYVRAVQTDDGVNRSGIVGILLCQNMGTFCRFIQAGLDRCQINIIIDVRVIGDKMSGNRLQRCNARIFSRGKFHHFRF